MARRAASNIIDVIPIDDAGAPTVFGPGAATTGSYRPESGWRGSAAIGLDDEHTRTVRREGQRGDQGAGWRDRLARPSPTKRSGGGSEGPGSAPPGRRSNRSGVVAVGFGAVVAVIVVVAIATGGASDHPATAPAATTTAATTVASTSLATDPATVAAGAQSAATSGVSTATTLAPGTIVVDVVDGSVVARGAASPRSTVVTADPVSPAVAPLYLPDLPQQYQLMTAEQTVPFGTVVSPPIARQLWTTGSPSATAPRWLQISVGETSLGADDGGVRVSTANGVAVVSHNPFGGLTASAAIAGGNATLSSAGLTLGELIGTLDGVILDGATLTFADGAVPADLHVLAQDTPADATTRRAATSVTSMAVSYMSSLDHTARLFIAATQGEPLLDQAWEAYLAPVHDPIDLGGGRTADVRSVNGSDGTWSWIDVSLDGTTLRITGTAPLADALAAARTVKRVGDERWTSVRAVAALNQQAYPAAQYPNARQLDQGPDGDRDRWSLISASGTDNAPDLYEVHLRGASIPFTQDDSPAIHLLADQDVTLVIGVAPSGHDGAFLHVVLGTASWTIPLQPQDDGGGNLVGVFAFRNVGIPTTELIDLGGQVLLTGASFAN